MINEDNTCPPCQGTGMGSNDHTRCHLCKGRGWLVKPSDEDEPDPSRYFDRSERCYD